MMDSSNGYHITSISFITEQSAYHGWFLKKKKIYEFFRKITGKKSKRTKNSIGFLFSAFVQMCTRTALNQGNFI